MTDEADGFEEFVRASSRALLRAAWVLTGDPSAAEDLVQASLAHTWVRWQRIRSHEAARVYVRRVMMTTFLGWRRRRWTSEISYAAVPTVAVSGDEIDQALTRDVLVSAVRALPARQRAVIVLRYLDDQSESATAEILGCSVGAVKSHAARAVRALREVPGLEAAITGRVSDG